MSAPKKPTKGQIRAEERMVEKVKRQGFIFQDANGRLFWPNGRGTVTKAVLDRLIEKGSIASSEDGLFAGCNQTFKLVDNGQAASR